MTLGGLAADEFGCDEIFSRGAAADDDDGCALFCAETPPLCSARGEENIRETGRARKHYLLPIQINKQLLITATTDALCGI